MNPRITDIVSISPFIINALWTDGKVRKIDFAKFLEGYFRNEESIYNKILTESKFLEAKTDGRTIYWDGMAEMIDYDGKSIPAPLDFCPDVLFNLSTPVY